MDAQQIKKRCDTFVVLTVGLLVECRCAVAPLGQSPVHLAMPVRMKAGQPNVTCLHVSFEQLCQQPNACTACTASRPVLLTGKLPTPAFVYRGINISWDGAHQNPRYIR